MGPRLVLHVGTMKTGTSYLQGRLFENQVELGARGVLVPADGWSVHVGAARELAHGKPGLWTALIDEVRHHDGTAVISTERLGPLRRPLVEQVRESLTGVEVEVVITARDLNRSIPALWQETIQNGRTWEYAEYLAGIEAWRPGHRAETSERPEAGRSFWRQMDLLRIVRIWQQVFGADRVTVITLPPPRSPRDLLWTRFCSLVDVAPEGMRESNRPNASLGAASAMAVRRLNELLNAEGLPYPEGAKLRKRVLAKHLLAARRPQEPSIGLTTPTWVQEQTGRIRRGLDRLDTRTIGSLEELEPVDVAGVDPATVPHEQLVEAALAGLAGVLARQIRGEEPIEHDEDDRDETDDDPGEEFVEDRED